MKLKILSVAILSAISLQSLALTKTIDFYSSNGVNRYSVSGKVKEIDDVDVYKNQIMIHNANRFTYLTVRKQTPYHIHYTENELNVYQIFENNKGKKINYNGELVKIISLQDGKLVAESSKGIVFIPLDNLVLPKDFFNEGKKGLKASFEKDINEDDSIYYSQPDESLSYSNSYQGVISNNEIKFTHYLDINNSSQNTFENVYLNFFLSETNIQRNVRPLARNLMMKANMAVSQEMMSDSIEKPVYENQNIQNLELISIKDPVNIYPNQNRLRYTEKSYPKEEYSKLNVTQDYRIYFGNELDNKSTYAEFVTKNTNLNNEYIKKIDSLITDIKNNERLFENMINIKVDKNDILPEGKIDIYETLNNNDKLIVSTTIGHTENKSLELFKNINRDLKITAIEFYDVKEESYKKTIPEKYIDLKVKSVTVENVGDLSYKIQLFGNVIEIKNGEKKIFTN